MDYITLVEQTKRISFLILAKRPDFVEGNITYDWCIVLTDFMKMQLIFK